MVVRVHVGCMCAGSVREYEAYFCAHDQSYLSNHSCLYILYTSDPVPVCHFIILFLVYNGDCRQERERSCSREAGNGLGVGVCENAVHAGEY